MTARSIVVLGALVAGCAWGANPFLKVDVNAGTQGGITQDGWSGFGIWVKILGLKPGIAYEFKAYGYDDNNTSSVTVTPMADGSPAGESGVFSYSSGTVFSPETDSDLCATVVTAVSDEEGALTFRLTGNPKPPILGGFTLAKSDHDVFSLFVDFGDNSSDKVAAGAQQFYYSESTDPRSASYGSQLRNGSTGRVTITLTQGTGLESKKFIVRDRNPTAYADVFPGFQEYRDCAILSQATSFRLFSDENGRIRLLNSVASGEVALAWLKIQYVPQNPGFLIIVL